MAAPIAPIPTKTTTSYPTAVHARKINGISVADKTTSAKVLQLSDGSQVTVNLAQLTSYMPSVGDYYCIPQEGNPYCVSKTSFAVTYTSS